MNPRKSVVRAASPAAVDDAVVPDAGERRLRGHASAGAAGHAVIPHAGCGAQVMRRRCGTPRAGTRDRAAGVGVVSAEECSCQVGYLLHTGDASVDAWRCEVCPAHAVCGTPGVRLELLAVEGTLDPAVYEEVAGRF